MSAAAAAVAGALERLLGGPAEVLAPGGDRLRRLGLALGPDPGLAAWCERERLDVLVVHRAHGVVAPPGTGLVGCHDPFDAALGLAGNRWLHERLGLERPRPLASKAVVAGAPDDLAERVGRLLGGEERRAGVPAATGLAVLADAMSDALVRAAAAAGAGLYVTGAWRPSAAAALRETDLAVLVTGHARAERWALGLLAELLAARLAPCDVAVRRPGSEA